jgi:serine/threonine-protein kinase
MDSGAQTIPATATSPLTGRGAILGTLLYMSPEQLEARDVDARSDIFSFGAMLYEMVTGVRPFAGQSQATIIAAILEREPAPIAESAPLTPPALDRVVRKCLAKDPDRRWQSAGDLCDELSWIAQGSGAQLATGSTVGVRRPRRWIPAAAIGALAIALMTVLVLTLFRQRESSPRVVRHLSLAMPDGVRLAPGGIALSSDGRSIAYVAEPVSHAGISQGPERVYLRRFDSDSATALPGTEGAAAPFFSPDGLWIGYFTERALMKISVLGGGPVKVTDVPPVSRGGTWAPDDTIIYSPSQSAALLRVTASGVPKPAVKDSPDAQLFPQVLPGGADVLFTRRRGTSSDLENADVVIQSLATGEEHLLAQGGAYGRYASGHLVFVRGGSLVAVPFDPVKREVKGTPLPIVDNVALVPTSGGAPFAVADDGTLVVARGSLGDTMSSAVWVDRTGKPLGPPLVSGRRLFTARLSPDQRRALFSDMTREGDSDIFMCDLARASLVRFSGDPADDFSATWTPDGKRVLYTSFAAGQLPLLVARSADGSGTAERVLDENHAPQFVGSVSADGVLAFTTGPKHGKGRSDIHVVPAGERRSKPFLSDGAEEFGPEFSPDGRWIAYVSTEGGPADVYVVPYPGPGPKRRLSSAGGAAPAWCASCGELFYQSPAGMMAVSFTAGAESQFGQPHLLFPNGSFIAMGREDGPRHYSVTQDGKRFLMLRRESADTAASIAIDVILDWVTGLTQRTKTGG